MSNNQDLTDAAIERSQAFIGAVLGADKEGNLPPDRHQIGGNNPPEPIVAPEDQKVAELVNNANRWSDLHKTIETEEVAAAAADWIDQLNKLHDAYKVTFDKEKEPHNEALKEIRDKWHPRLERLKVCLQAINPAFLSYKRKKAARLSAERAAAEREAAEKQRQAEQLAEQAKAGRPQTMIDAAEAAREAERARKAVAAVPQRAQVRGNLGGRTHSLRSVWHAEIVVQDLVYQKFKDHPDVRALLHRLANAAVRAQGGPRPEGGAKAGLCEALQGCYVYESQE